MFGDSPYMASVVNVLNLISKLTFFFLLLITLAI